MFALPPSSPPRITGDGTETLFLKIQLAEAPQPMRAAVEP